MIPCIAIARFIVNLFAYIMGVFLAYIHRYPNPSSFSYERRFFCPFEYALQPPAWYKPEHIALEKPELPLGVSELRRYRGPQCFMIPGNHGNDCSYMEYAI
jgi:hypothetical protein